MIPGGSQARGQQGQGGYDSPNPQTGRPQKGGDSPQLSSKTKKKIENAGLSSGSGGEPVSREDFNELVDQNKKIIGLLNDLVESIEGSGNNRMR